MTSRILGGARGLLPVFGIAVGVAVLGTVTGFAWDHVHKVSADDVADRGVTAQAGADSTQLLSLSNWGVSVSFPMVKELPLLNSAVEGGDTIGLSSADLMALGSDCLPARNALGSITRYPTGAYGTSVKPRAGANVVSTVGQYDFVYQYPQTACADLPTATETINREAPIVLEALGSLTTAGTAAPTPAVTPEALATPESTPTPE